MQKFKGSSNPLSNFFLCKIQFQNHTFMSTEHCYQYIKACYHNQYKLASDIFNSKTAMQVKKLSKKISCCLAWHNVKSVIMFEILKCKFDQVSVFRKALYHTKDCFLIHNVKDSYWGIINQNGLNVMGLLLMLIQKLTFFR